MAKVATMLVAVNAAAVVVMVPVSFIVSALALDGLETFDLWLRRKHEARSLAPVGEKET